MGYDSILLAVLGTTRFGGELSPGDTALQDLPQVLDWVEIRALARPLHHRDVDSRVAEPALNEL